MQLLVKSCILLFGLFAFSQEKPIETISKKIDGVTKVYVKNNTAFTYSVKFNFSGTGCKPSKSVPMTKVIEPNSEIELFHIIPTKSKWKYSTRETHIIGDITAKPNRTFTYDLPFAKGESYRVSQAYHGTFSHQDKFALDFTMPEGTPLHAIRTGKVIKLKKDSDSGCPDIKCIKEANYVWIEHKDGTIAEYAHLQFNGTDLKLGDIVQKGDKIGLSGNTGFSQSPHLHLEVFVQAIDGKRKTIATKFRVNGKVLKSFKKGETYTNSF